ncbi:MAG: hypothetical protein WKF43_09810 [Acidimicrobiales bacterium]
MLWPLVLLGVVLVVLIGILAVGQETSVLARTVRPAVFDLEEAVDFIAERLPSDVAGRVSHDDVRWVLRTDVDLLEEAADDPTALDPPEALDEDGAVGRILARADAEGRDVADVDIVAVLDARMAYLDAIGAIGPPVPDPGPSDEV